MGAAADSRSVRRNGVARTTRAIAQSIAPPRPVQHYCRAGRFINSGTGGAVAVPEAFLDYSLPPHFSQRITNSHAASLIHGVRSEISFFS